MPDSDESPEDMAVRRAAALALDKPAPKVSEIIEEVAKAIDPTSFEWENRVQDCTPALRDVLSSYRDKAREQASAAIAMFLAIAPPEVLARAIDPAAFKYMAPAYAARRERTVLIAVEAIHALRKEVLG